MGQEFHKKAIAAEEEGSGFARSCREHGIPWLVFRGISDHGNNKSRLPEWKVTAALTAATVTTLFIQRDYRSIEEERF